MNPDLVVQNNEDWKRFTNFTLAGGLHCRLRLWEALVCSPKAHNVGLREFGDIVPGVFTAVLARPTKHLTLVAVLLIGVEVFNGISS